LVDILNEMASGYSLALKQAKQSIEQLIHTVNVREEEVAILWWLQAHFSRDVEKPFSELGYLSGTIIFPMELADLTKFVPGPESAVAILIRALQLAGAPSSSEETTIANAINSTSREWRERTSGEISVESSGLLTPILLAIHKSLATQGREEWLPVYENVCDIPVNKPFALIPLSLQLFHERMLLDAIAGATS
jgi:hypothetical protein